MYNNKFLNFNFSPKHHFTNSPLDITNSLLLDCIGIHNITNNLFLMLNYIGIYHNVGDSHLYESQYNPTNPNSNYIGSILV